MLLDLHGEVYIVGFSLVPISRAVKVQEARVVTRDFTDFSAILRDLSAEIVLLLEIVRAELHFGHQIILSVGKRLLTQYLQPKRAYEEPVNFVFGVCHGDLTAIVKYDLPMPQILDLSRLQASSDRPLLMTIDLVVLMVHHKVGDGRVM